MRRSIASVAVAAALLGAAVADPAAADAGPASAAGQHAARSRMSPAIVLPAATPLAMGNETGLAMRGGVLYGWGDNENGEVGSGAAYQSFDFTPVPVARGAVPAGVRITQLAEGNNNYTLAVGSNGKAYGWGNGFAGELGTGDQGIQPTPVAVKQGAIPSGVTIVKIVAAGDASWALGSNGKVYGWGQGLGFLGDGSSTPERDAPVAVAAGAIPSGVKIVDIAVHADTADVVMAGSDGKLYAFGSNNSEDQLGSTSTSFQAKTPVAVPAGAIPAGVKIVKVAASASDFEALGNNGEVYVWGAGNLGQLGNGSTSMLTSATPVAVEQGAIPTGVKIVAISGVNDGTIAIGSNGKAYAWGDNTDGVLGDNSIATRTAPVAVQQGAVPSGVRLVAVSSMSLTVAVRGSDGNIYTWGNGTDGALGIQANSARTPVRVVFPALVGTRVTVSVSGTRTFGQMIAVTARVSPASATGSVTFSDGSSVLGRAAVSPGSGGVGTVVTTRQRVGRQTITAVFVPDAALDGSQASVAITVAKAALKAGTPRVTGLVRVGRVLTALPGAWTAGAKLGYQWLANLRPIPGAHFKTLHLTKALRGKKIRVRVTGSKPNYVTVAKASNPTVAVKPA